MQMKMIPFDISAMMGESGPKQEKARPLHEAQIAALKDYERRIRARNPYKAGDLVTPRSDSGLRDAGEPHIVVEIVDSESTFARQMREREGYAPDMRIAWTDADGSIRISWAMHAQYETYVAK